MNAPKQLTVFYHAFDWLLASSRLFHLQLYFFFSFFSFWPLLFFFNFPLVLPLFLSLIFSLFLFFFSLVFLSLFLWLWSNPMEIAYVS